MTPSPDPFVFYTEIHLVGLTGIRARNLTELTAILHHVPGSSVFHHTHHQYLAHHFEKPVFYNDFAWWAANALREASLGERLAALDLLSFSSIRQLREAILAVLQEHLDAGHTLRECLPGEEFPFCRVKSFVMPLGLTAADAAELFQKLPAIANTSVYFHFFEARLRLEQPTNDFSAWLRTCGHDKLATAIHRLDPYVFTLDELKAEIIRLGQKYLGV